MAKQGFKDLLTSSIDKILSLYSLKMEKDIMRLIPSNITTNEVKVLSVINKYNNNTSTNIAKKLNVTKGTLTTAIDKLVAKDCVFREESSKDARVVFLNLTQKGKEIAEIYSKLSNKIIDEIDAELNQYEKGLLLIALSKVEDVLYK